MTNDVNENEIDIPEILELIPHRYPFLLVDKVTEYKPFEYLHAIKNVSINEPFFQGHFPGRPIMPGVLILEAMAQAGGILFSKSMVPSEGKEFLYFFAGIDNARFKQIVRPGDTLEFKLRVLKHKKEIWKMHAEAYVAGDLACSAELMSAAKEVDSDR